MSLPTYSPLTASVIFQASRAELGDGQGLLCPWTETALRPPLAPVHPNTALAPITTLRDPGVGKEGKGCLSE